MKRILQTTKSGKKETCGEAKLRLLSELDKVENHIHNQRKSSAKSRGKEEPNLCLTSELKATVDHLTSELKATVDHLTSQVDIAKRELNDTTSKNITELMAEHEKLREITSKNCVLSKALLTKSYEPWPADAYDVVKIEMNIPEDEFREKVIQKAFGCEEDFIAEMTEDNDLGAMLDRLMEYRNKLLTWIPVCNGIIFFKTLVQNNSYILCNNKLLYSSAGEYCTSKTAILSDNFLDNIKKFVRSEVVDKSEKPYVYLTGPNKKWNRTVDNVDKPEAGMNDILIVAVVV